MTNVALLLVHYMQRINFVYAVQYRPGTWRLSITLSVLQYGTVIYKPTESDVNGTEKKSGLEKILVYRGFPIWLYSYNV